MNHKPVRPNYLRCILAETFWSFILLSYVSFGILEVSWTILIETIGGSCVLENFSRLFVFMWCTQVIRRQLAKYYRLGVCGHVKLLARVGRRDQADARSPFASREIADSRSSRRIAIGMERLFVTVARLINDNRLSWLKQSLYLVLGRAVPVGIRAKDTIGIRAACGRNELQEPWPDLRGSLTRDSRARVFTGRNG